jgi:hypothetical protein
LFQTRKTIALSVLMLSNLASYAGFEIRAHDPGCASFVDQPAAGKIEAVKQELGPTTPSNGDAYRVSNIFQSLVRQNKLDSPKSLTVVMKVTKGPDDLIEEWYLSSWPLLEPEGSLSPADIPFLRSLMDRHLVTRIYAASLTDYERVLDIENLGIKPGTTEFAPRFALAFRRLKP